ncbi:flagellar basal-body rod protein FlgG [Kistimonas asteriae]|uniref:flagellar basal-body rod protein FlgG n=1 Tax=Kistimonas asteriae TaxID=517724 RepID=UPI001BAAD895|nr:flagellar basal-body rod protein FlgG [Kistimonas asteriae]
MHPALWVSMTGLSAQDYNLSTSSNNLANIDTVGFKKNRVTFEDLFYQVLRQPGAKADEINDLPSGQQQGTGVRIVASQKVFSGGNLQTTTQPLDLAISGHGFFQVQLPDGTSAYTRNGQFQLNADGNMVMASGLPLEPAITIPQEALNITIGEDGTVSVSVSGEVEPRNVGQITLTNFINPTGLEARGGNIFVETVASGDAIEGAPGENGLGLVKQYTLEASNVQAVEELVNLIVAQRSYEMNTRAIKATDDMMEFLIRSS